jgi:hypothetical protein
MDDSHLRRRGNSMLRLTILAAGFGLFGIASIGLAAAGLRPVQQSVTELAYTAPAVDEELAPAIEESEPAEVEPGEARPVPRLARESPAEESPSPAAAPEPVVADPPRFERFGTAIDFVRSPSIAYERAAREQKLVMMLHLAGQFEDPGFT